MSLYLNFLKRLILIFATGQDMEVDGEFANTKCGLFLLAPPYLLLPPPYTS